LLIWAGSVLCLPFAREAGPVAAVLVGIQQLGDAAATFFLINALSLRQGRVNAGVRFGGGLATLTGALAGGLIGQAFGLRAALALGALATAGAALWLLPARLGAPSPAEAAELPDTG